MLLDNAGIPGRLPVRASSLGQVGSLLRSRFGYGAPGHRRLQAWQPGRSALVRRNGKGKLGRGLANWEWRQESRVWVRPPRAPVPSVLPSGDIARPPRPQRPCPR